MSNKIKDNKINRLRSVFQNGLFLFNLTNRLKKIGIDIRPYYWEREYVKPCDPPKIKDNSNEFTIKILGSKEIKFLYPVGYKEHLEKIKNGKIWVGIMHNDNIAAHSWAETNEFSVIRDQLFKLENNQAYLGGMYTAKSYRGRNLAPHLRYHVYQILKEKGMDEVYSITDYFNKSSIKFKKKLNSEHDKLHLYINLFNKYRWNFILRDYRK